MNFCLILFKTLLSAHVHLLSHLWIILILFSLKAERKPTACGQLRGKIEEGHGQQYQQLGLQAKCGLWVVTETCLYFSKYTSKHHWHLNLSTGLH